MKPDPVLVQPAIFWFWNDDVTPASIAAKLDIFRERGFRSVYLHPMPADFRQEDFHGGLRVPYLSPAFFELVAEACEQARRRGMSLDLYDEGGWPSGRAGGLLVSNNPEFAACGLRKMDHGFEQVRFSLTNDYPDLMNLAATRRFIELTHERYKRWVGHEFGRTIRSIFTDEPRLLGGLGTETIPWSAELPEAFGRQNGYPLEDVLHLLFEPAETSPIRRAHRDFTATVSRQIRDSYYAPIAQWCEANGLLFEGHHSGEDEFALHTRYFGHFLEQAAEYHLPGIDAIWRQIFPGTKRGNFASLAASSAWIRGNRIATAELFGVYGPGVTLGQMRWVSNFLAVRGVNRHGIMAYLEAGEGRTRSGTCGQFSPDDPRWRDLDLYLAQTERACRFSLRGESIAPVAVFYRDELLAAQDVKDFERQHEALTNAVLSRGYPLFFVGEHDLPRAVERGVTHLIVYAESPLSPSERVAIREASATMEMQYLHESTDLQLPPSPLLRVLGEREGLRVLPLRADDGSTELMLFNESERVIKLCFRWTGSPLRDEAIDDDNTLDLRPLRWKDDACHVELLPGELRAFAAAADWPVGSEWELSGAETLDGEWSCQAIERFIIGERGRLESIEEVPRRLDHDELAWEGSFSGSVRFRHRLRTEISSETRYVLDVGEAFDVCEVFLDGRSVGRRAWAPWQIDITSALREGARDISIRVSNTAAAAWSQIIDEGDLPPALNNMYWRTATPFLQEGRRIGLAGPVRLLSFILKDMERDSLESQVLCHPR